MSCIVGTWPSLRYEGANGQRRRRGKYGGREAGGAARHPCTAEGTRSTLESQFRWEAPETPLWSLSSLEAHSFPCLCSPPDERRGGGSATCCAQTSSSKRERTILPRRQPHIPAGRQQSWEGKARSRIQRGAVKSIVRLHLAARGALAGLCRSSGRCCSLTALNRTMCDTERKIVSRGGRRPLRGVRQKHQRGTVKAGRLQPLSSRVHPYRAGVQSEPVFTFVPNLT